MLTAGFLTGGLGYWMASPLIQAKLRFQAQLEKKGTVSSSKPYKSTIDLLKRTIANDGIKGLFRGSTVLCMRGALLTAGHLLGYDGTKDIMKGYDIMTDGPFLHFISSTSAAFLASVFCMPADYTMARFMTLQDRGSEKVSVLKLIREDHAKHGILRFYRGFSLMFMMLLPIMCFYNLTYEEMRFQLGIGYLD